MIRLAVLRSLPEGARVRGHAGAGIHQGDVLSTHGWRWVVDAPQLPGILINGHQ